jgi:hypothetical protein
MKKLKALRLKKITLKDLDQTSIENIAAGKANKPTATELNSCPGRHTCPGGTCTMVGMRCVGGADR